MHVLTSVATKVSIRTYTHTCKQFVCICRIPVTLLILKKTSHLNRKEAAVVHVSGRLLKQKQDKTKHGKDPLYNPTAQNDKHRLIKSLSYL